MSEDTLLFQLNANALQITALWLCTGYWRTFSSLQNDDENDVSSLTLSSNSFVLSQKPNPSSLILSVLIPVLGPILIIHIGGRRPGGAASVQARRRRTEVFARSTPLPTSASRARLRTLSAGTASHFDFGGRKMHAWWQCAALGRAIRFWALFDWLTCKFLRTQFSGCRSILVPTYMAVATGRRQHIATHMLPQCDCPPVHSHHAPKQATRSRF